MRFSQLYRKALGLVAVAAIATTLTGQRAEAATEVANLAVSATVLTSCTIGTLPVNFGSYDPLGVNNTNPLDTTVGGTVDITCANGLPVVITLGQGGTTNAASTDAAPLREMAGPAPGDILTYNLYTNAPGGTVWGNTAATGVGTTGTGASQTFAVHGRVPQAQNPAAGNYSDTVVATVTF